MSVLCLLDYVSFYQINHVVLSSVIKTYQMIYYFLPELVIAGTIFCILGKVAYLLPNCVSKKKLAVATLNILQCGLFMAGVVYFFHLIWEITGAPFNAHFCTTTYTSSLKLLLTLTSLFIADFSRTYICSHKHHLLEYPAVLALSVFFMLLLVSANHLLTAFLAIIGFSLNLYVLILFDTEDYAAREASIKYYYLSTFSSGLIVFAFFIFFLLTSTGQFYYLAAFFTENLRQDSQLPLIIAVAFLLWGIFFKISAFPGHL